MSTGNDAPDVVCTHLLYLPITTGCHWWSSFSTGLTSTLHWVPPPPSLPPIGAGSMLQPLPQKARILMETRGLRNFNNNANCLAISRSLVYQR